MPDIEFSCAVDLICAELTVNETGSMSTNMGVQPSQIKTLVVAQ